MASINKIMTSGATYNLEDTRLDTNISSADSGKLIGVDSNGKMVAVNAPATGVVTFNGRSGAVSPQSGDYTYTMVGADQAGTAASQVTAHNGSNSAHSDLFSAKADLVSPALTGTPTSTTADAGTNTTQIATTAFVATAINNVLESSKAMTYEGTVDGTHDLPASHTVGDTYVVAAAGTYAGVACENGDLIICKTSGTSAVNTDWNVVHQAGGGVKGPASSVDGHLALFDGSGGNVIKDGGDLSTLLPSMASASTAGKVKYAQGTINIASGGFVADLTYQDYPFRASIVVTGCTANHFADVAFDLAAATSGNLAPVCDTYNGGIYVYAKEQTTAAVTGSYRISYNV